MAIIKEFKEFIARGNVIDLAVAVVMGGAFGKIVSSFTADVLMPPIGLLVGGVNFTSLKLPLGTGENPPTLNYGNFLQATFDFLIIAAGIFLIVKLINSFKRKEEAAPAAPPPPTKDQELLAEIRDLLKAKR